MTGSGMCMEVIVYRILSEVNVSPDAQSIPNKPTISPEPAPWMSSISSASIRTSRPTRTSRPVRQLAESPFFQLERKSDERRGGVGVESHFLFAFGDVERFIDDVGWTRQVARYCIQ